MSAPIGNNNGRGVKGRSGRKSAYQEKNYAEFLRKIFFEDMDKNEIEGRVALGKYSVRDVFILKALNGDGRVLVEIFKKLFPDKTIELQSSCSLTDKYRDGQEIPLNN